MKSDLQAPADLIAVLRQQLLLAQVRIMELEDERDELAPRLAETSALLAAAQSLAEAKVGEAIHLEKVRADLEAEFNHLRHAQHVTNEALALARDEIATLTASIETLRQRSLVDRGEIDRLLASTTALQEALAQTGRQLTESERLSTERAARSQQLEADLGALKSSRTWRWTAWLRAIGRWWQ
jgi:chromosome segregation ATPase